LLLGSAAIAWHRQEAPAADLFAATTFVAGTGALLMGVDAALGMERLLQLTVVILTLLLPVPWMLFTLEYTGRTDMRSSGIASIIGAVPLLGIVATGLIVGSQLIPGVTLPTPGIANGFTAVVVGVLVLTQWTAVVYAGALAVIGTGFLLSMFRRYAHLNWRIGISLAVFGTVPWLSLLLGLQLVSAGAFTLPGAVLGGFGIGAVAITNALVRYDMFGTVPAAGKIGPETVVEELNDLVVVTDDEGRVLKINAAVEQRLEIDRESVISADLTDLLGTPLASLTDIDTIELQTDTGRHPFEPTVSQLTDQHDRTIGYAVALRDVTVRNTRQQRLRVLNRVLRHNLRNEMTVIRLRAELLRDGIADSELVESAEAVVEQSDRLTTLSEKARELEKVMGDAKLVTDEIRVAALVENVRLDAADRYPSASIETEIPSGLVVTAIRGPLKRALMDLVENALEHNSREEPCVKLRARYEPDRTYPLTLSVTDDGPGIPEPERRVIRHGREAPLQHGSGLGLWTVRWAVTRLGGELDIEVQEPRGSTVSLHLPRARRVEDESEHSAVETGDRDTTGVVK
jgi:signal transduction histidine kinase